METIVHKIRLKDVAKAGQFESWVENTDYATCPELPSVQQFEVHRASDAADAPFHYFEVIRVSSRKAFEADMESTAFQGLVDAFATMADVVEEVEGEQLGRGYQAS